MKRVNPLRILNILRLRLVGDSPGERFRLTLYQGVIVMAVLVFGFSVFHVQSISDEIKSNIQSVLNQRPWINDLVVVDGRDVLFRGTIEPDSGIENEMQKIISIPGVRSISNVLNEKPKPSAHLFIRKNRDDLIAYGKLNGEILDTVIAEVTRVFPHMTLKDRIKIDDRLGRPLWIEGLGKSLEKLARLAEFEINGWRDQILLSGYADSDRLRREMGYTVPVFLIEEVSVVNQLRLPVSAGFPEISVVSDWNGASITGKVPSEAVRSVLIAAARQAFGQNDIEASLEIDDQLLSENQLIQLSRILPYLSNVQNLRLESTGKGYIVWGRVDQPALLGKFLYARNEAGLEQIVDSRIRISKGEKEATITLFSDGQRAIISGILPSSKSREQVLYGVSTILAVDEINDFISVQPDVIYSPWIVNWENLLSALPEKVIGITIDQQSILVTGNSSKKGQLTAVDDSLNRLLPDLQHLNWISTTN